MKRKHEDFIKTPVFKILEESITATNVIELSMTVHPLWDYVFQSTFIKMTGSQEQKMKCLIWEMATEDYVYRYERVYQTNVGECSSYKDKNKIYNDFIKSVGKGELERKVNNIILNSFLKLKKCISNSEIINHSGRKWDGFIDVYNSEIKDKIADNFIKKENKNEHLLLSTVKDIYENHLYRQRNRIAHNLLSYQYNLPTLTQLADENYKYENYFLWFFILIVIDEIFIELFKQFCDKYNSIHI